MARARSEDGSVKLVQATAARMRELVFDRPPDTQISSLPELARLLGVGVVTVQQAARILEHEGLLEVRRGPGGGYFGKRPDEAALERSIAAYVRMHDATYFEALDMMNLLNSEVVVAASACTDDALHGELRALIPRIDVSDTEAQRVSFEEDLHAIFCRMVHRPVAELLTRVIMRVYKASPIPPLFRGEDGIAAWKVGRHRLVQAVLQRDEDLARFEAMRNRQQLLRNLRELRTTDAESSRHRHE